MMKPDHSAVWRLKLYDIIFEADTFEGRLYEVVLLFAIAGSEEL
jgi:hypothetical protein